MTSPPDTNAKRPEVMFLWRWKLENLFLCRSPRAELEEGLASLRELEEEALRENGPITLAQVQRMIAKVEQAMVVGDRMRATEEHWRVAVETDVFDHEL